MTSRAYYNEIDAYAAQWLRNLIKQGLIANGDVDTRSIADVRPVDFRGYTQCHFFAGFGGWSGAFRLSGIWPDHRPVWSGSCPCQPFSLAGKQGGFADERHLWPYWQYLIEQCRPSVVFGEQVASASEWLGLVQSDMEAMDYAVGCMPVEAACAGADHLRDRFWFVADVEHARERRGRLPRSSKSCCSDGVRASGEFTRSSDSFLSNADIEREGNGIVQRGGQQCGSGSVAENSSRSLQHASQHGWGEGWTEHELRSRGITAAVASIGNSQIVECPDGKWRRLPPPGVRWLGVGIPARVAKLRTIGNAIDLRPAAEFIRAYDETLDK